MSHIKTIIISPSGGYYGSEQILHEHLIYTEKVFKVFVSRNKNYISILRQSNLKHSITSFKSVKWLYFQIFLLLFFKDYKTVYCNEGGHIRYLKILARCFPRKTFIVHIRLVEDTKANRIKNFITTNMRLITVSHFIRCEIMKQNPKINSSKIETVHDYYIKNYNQLSVMPLKDIVRIGVIGRVTSAKGVSFAGEFLDYWDRHISKKLECYFYGDVDKENTDVQIFNRTVESLSNVSVSFKGFIKDKDELFETFDIAIHFNPYEPFPRIYFDAMSRITPVIGFNSGGIAEQAQIFGFEKHLVEKTVSWPKEMCRRVLEIHENIEKCKKEITEKQYLFDNKLDIKKYISKIESYFN
ncbi:glycosyltransferase [Paucihalobacter ruber]|uniref:Glycosyltransferase n=1 Tax=Paucihalobacter ruber TaxID=2567861 RepID=A0A506PPV6_9FLAO|nr:glycosyltransferase [Paucihalobacter ruber]TPV35741.1 glycosyltransferase [Paucihalobacter ruber]